MGQGGDALPAPLALSGKQHSPPGLHLQRNTLINHPLRLDRPHGSHVACHGALHAMGCNRIFTNVKVNIRTDRDQTLEDKVASVEALLQQQPDRSQ
ncbi:MAG: hypothetical protein DCF24_01170 [Cyanobium sp.]|nr:MAG: hypothetical protein DCF24_01170 [Cyanobium sp.]PZV04118.1 MAG: hypothetical protein DCF23_07305 [Cyanobium sp.]